MPSTPILSGRTASAVFLVFAVTYFFSALVRAVTATLAAPLTEEFQLTAGELGLLSGSFAIGFSLTQLPLGRWLDRLGPRLVQAACLGIAAAGCLAFAKAPDFASLTLSRALIGAGVGACLMAPLTAFRRWFTVDAQLRANSWILMSGSLGMVFSTLPVQMLLPVIGWRGVFVALAVVFALAICAQLVWVPGEGPPPNASEGLRAGSDGYADVWRQRTFRRYAGLGFVNYGGMVAMQTLWVGPWLVNVAGQTPQSSAAGLFLVNSCMLLAFLGWGLVMPRLMRTHWKPDRLMAWGTPLTLALLAANLALGSSSGAGAWAAYCVSCTVMSLAQPLVGRSFPPALAGRAMAAFNLVIFVGIFVTQWGIGIAIDLLDARGVETVQAYRGAVALYAVASLLTYCHFLWGYRRDLVIAADDARMSAAGK